MPDILFKFFIPSDCTTCKGRVFKDATQKVKGHVLWHKFECCDRPHNETVVLVAGVGVTIAEVHAPREVAVALRATPVATTG